MILGMEIHFHQLLVEALKKICLKGKKKWNFTNYLRKTWGGREEKGGRWAPFSPQHPDPQSRKSRGTHSLLLELLCPEGAFSSSFVFLLSLALFSSSFWAKQMRKTSSKDPHLHITESGVFTQRQHWAGVSQLIQTPNPWPILILTNPCQTLTLEQNENPSLAAKLQPDKSSNSQVVHFSTDKLQSWNLRKICQRLCTIRRQIWCCGVWRGVWSMPGKGKNRISLVKSAQRCWRLSIDINLINLILRSGSWR